MVGVSKYEIFQNASLYETILPELFLKHESFTNNLLLRMSKEKHKQNGIHFKTVNEINVYLGV